MIKELFLLVLIGVCQLLIWDAKAQVPANSLAQADQQAESIALLDFLHAHHFNAVIFQVRPQADALYESDLEPWSYYLTGKQGTPPSPYYDPLAFWIAEAALTKI